LKAASFIWFRSAFLSALAVFSGCAQEPRITESQGHISLPPPAQTASAIPAPVQIPPQLPPPKVQAKPITYNVVVTEVPAKELLFSLARDTKLNIDVHPNIQGVVTLNAINETLPAILDRIAYQVNIRYRLEGNTLIVTPDTPYLKSYQVNYVNLTRKTVSNIGVATQVATTGTGPSTGGSSSSGGGAGGNNSSSTTVSSTSNNEFWEILAANIRDILKSTRSVNQSSEDKNARVEAVRASREERLQQASAVARAGQAAPQLFSSIFGKQGETFAEAKDEVIVNPSSGTVLVMATEVQHKIINQYIDSVMTASNRQVLIEATIVEVTLKDQFSAGIDWTQLVALGTGSTGFAFKSVTNLAGSLTAFQTLTYQNANDNFRATIKLLDSFGEARVLSSPKLLVLNNQTSLLKVVENLVYFSVQSTPATTSSSGGVISPATYTTTANTVPVGVIMAVTPQINESGRVTLVVRPTISRQNGSVDDPNPDLKLTVPNKVPIIQVREMESVLQVPSGETVILGGLMQDDVAKNRDGLPGLTDHYATNVLFGTRERKAAQTELVIFLRPTVITNPSLSSDELSFYKRYLPQAQPAKP